MPAPKPATGARNLPVGADQFINRLAELPGEATALLAFSDWLEENDRAALAAVARARTPKIAKRYALCVELHDSLLAVDVAGARPFPMPAPDRQHGRRSRGQLVALVRAALRPFAFPGVTVAKVPGWWNPREVVIRLPHPALFVGTGDPADGAFPIPWPISAAELLEAAGLALGALMPRLFPDEPLRAGYDETDSFVTPFWAIDLRPNS